ncbi:SapC family protein [Pelomonas sp. APW6]|uniref:SapC family protein n=1 Tax=Roseateles subflavus TaxID=3053353 RepID=A0ABT7LLJ3_9BURK|nr:SapC family protein [Pelomonas sp. APW6]MDL5033025.1 SapC family protein [Pelomonas sp. APW6]
MSNPPMFGSVVPLDRELHKKLHLRTDLSTVDKIKELNSLFLTTVEFSEACKEFPIVFVRVGEAPKDGGKQAVAPLVVLGLKPGHNLFIKDGVWTADYAPAYVRRYPFMMAHIDDQGNMALCFDDQWAGFSETEGSALFAEDGQATEFLVNAKNFVESYERETERTRAACHELVQLGILQDMRFESSDEAGHKVDVDGFMTIDEKKLAELDDATIVRLHRNGLLALLEMHRISLGNMAKLAQLQLARKD